MDPDSTQISHFFDGFLTQQILEFGLLCAVVALVLILLDWIMLRILDRSFLDISYGSKSRLLVLGGWAFASGIVGILVASINIVQSNLQAAIAVAAGWPLILSRLVENSVAAVQTTTEEEEEE